MTTTPVIPQKKLIARHRLARGVIAGSAFLFCLWSTQFLGYFAFSFSQDAPRWLPHFCLFFPQAVFPFDQLHLPHHQVWTPLFSDTVAAALNFGTWTLAVSLFALWACRVRTRFWLPVAITVIFTIPVMIGLVFGAFDISMAFDGP